MEQNQRENYFILLGLDPNKPWSQADYEAKLLAKRGEWTKGLNNTRKKIEAKQNLDSVRDIDAVMRDESKRNAEAANALQRLGEIKSRAMEELQRRVDFFAAKGYIDDMEVKAIVSDFKERFDLDEVVVRAEIAKRSLPDKLDDPSKLEPLDNMLMQTIAQNLKVLQKRDLYDFLNSESSLSRDLGPSTRIDELKTAATEILNRNRQNGVKDYRVTASNELAGLANRVFNTAATQTRYHLALGNQNVNTLDEEIKKITVVNKVIHEQQFEMLVQYGAKLGISPKRAGEYVVKRASQMGVSVLATGFNFEKKLMCSKCSTLNDDQAFCFKCSAPLRTECPSCGDKVLVANGACGRCSFPVGNEIMVREALKQVKLYVANSRFDDAFRLLEFAAGAWTTVPPRTLNDPLTVEITRQRKIIEALRQKVADLHTSLEGHRYFEARKILRELDPVGTDPEYSTYHKLVSNKIAWAKRELDKAQEIDRRGGDSVEMYQSILRECRDYEDARNALSKSPPSPPSKLTATTKDRTVSLTWKASASKHISYIIVRKPYSSPLSASDGTILSSTSNVFFDDTDPVIGLPLHYAIYADREGVLSATGATLTHPILVVAPVSNISAQVSSGQVYLRWEAPASVTDVRIFRSTTRPHPGQLVGDIVKPIDHSQMIDKDVLNGRVYFYSIVNVFLDSDGREVMSGSVTAEVCPQEAPDPITEIFTEIKQDERGDQLILSWDAPSKGEVVFLQSDDKPPFKKGEIVPQAIISRAGTLIPTSKHRLSLQPQNNAVLFLTALVLFQNQAYIGKTIEYANLEDVSNLKYTRQVGEFHLRWDWVRYSDKCIVAYSHNGYPSGPNDEDAIRHEITRAQYEGVGFYRIKNPLQRDHYIVVYAVMDESGKRMISSGLGPTARTRISVSSLVTIDYCIEHKRVLLRKGSVILKITATGKGTLPQMRLVAKQGAPPIRKNDGEVICDVQSCDLLTSPTTLTFNLDAFVRPQQYAKLFLEDDTLYDTQGGNLQINHPPIQKAGVF